MSPTQKSETVNKKTTFKANVESILRECHSLNDTTKDRIRNLVEFAKISPQQKATLMRYLGQVIQLQNQNLSQFANTYPHFWETLQHNIIRELLIYLHSELNVE